MKIIRFARLAIIAAIALATAGTIASVGAQESKDAAPTHAANALPSAIPVTTSSKAARADYEQGFLYREDLLFTDRGIEYFRKAVKDDPTFARGHATLAFFTTDPREEVRERTLSTNYLASASPDEQSLIRWMNDVKEGQLVPAIATMNDLLAKYPNDKRFANMSAEWLCSGQQSYDHGEEILQRLLASDPGYYPALNNLAYCYALSGDVQKAPPLMERYVAALPAQPNPQDSYAEILRMSGDFQGSIQHYQMALQIDPTFTTSQLGIASNYALMGDQDRARSEYQKAIAMTKDPATKLEYQMLSAMTYYRANQLDLGRKAYRKLAAQAQIERFAVDEAEIHRDMALFNPDPKAALRDADQAEVILMNGRDLPRSERDAELASILQTRAFLAERANTCVAAEKAAERLNVMALESRDNLIQQSYHSANGAYLLLQKKYVDAISELEDDPRNPLSLTLLAAAQDKAGQSADAQKTLATLAAINDERVETAAAAPPARAALKGGVTATERAGSQ